MRFHFSSALWASILATIIMTIVMYFLDMNLVAALGLSAGMSGSMVFVLGGLIHLFIGIIFGLIYALIFEPILKALPGFLAGAIYSLIPFFIALYFMQPFMETVGKAFGMENVPVESKVSLRATPTFKEEPEGYAYNPSMSETWKGVDSEKITIPADDKDQTWLYSLISHLSYGVILGWTYRPRRPRVKKKRK